MIKIHADRVKKVNTRYIEDYYSAYEIVRMDADTFKKVILLFQEAQWELHTCYNEFISHVGRFIRDFGIGWLGDEIVVITDENGEKKEHGFDDKGNIQGWTIGYFG